MSLIIVSPILRRWPRGRRGRALPIWWRDTTAFRHHVNSKLGNGTILGHRSGRQMGVLTGAHRAYPTPVLVKKMTVQFSTPFPSI
jgi:hypothetical protein